MPTRSERGERGSGVVSTMFGAIVFLAFILFATNVLVGLYATSVTTAVAFDTAEAVARQGNDPATVADAEASARNHLKSLDQLQFHWVAENEQTGLRVTAKRPSFLPVGLLAGTRLTTIDRTVWVRNEVER